MTTMRIFVEYAMHERTIISMPERATISLVVNPSDVIGSVKTKIQEKEDGAIFPTNRLILYFSPVEEREDGSDPGRRSHPVGLRHQE